MCLLGIGPFNSENFVSGRPNFVTAASTEFRGINLLGDNSNDGHFAASNAQVCQQVCNRNPECAGYSFYQPGQRCYMFMSGDFVPKRPGFTSGKKVKTD
jgi:hypothetical protein